MRHVDTATLAAREICAKTNETSEFTLLDSIGDSDLTGVLLTVDELEPGRPRGPIRRCTAGPDVRRDYPSVGLAAMIGTALLAAVMVPPPDLPARALLVSIAAGLYAALVADLRAVVTVAALAMATFVGFLAHRFGELTGSGDAWSYAVPIPFAVALGAGYRYMRAMVRAVPEDGPYPLVAAPGSGKVAPPGDSRGA